MSFRKMFEEDKKGKGSPDYQKFVAKMIKKKGYESFDDIPKDKIDDFWNIIDKEWNSSSEPGKDGEV